LHFSFPEENKEAQAIIHEILKTIKIRSF